MTQFNYRRLSVLSILFALVLSLTACFESDGETGNKKADQDKNKTISGEKWKVPTGADPKY
jgi:uncharacterized lipoprotein